MRKITNVEPTNSLKLKVTYDNGRTVTFDAGPLVKTGGVFAKLAEESEFEKVKVGPRGRSLEWPGQVDLCADAIWIKATGETESFDEKASQGY
jgi:transcription antitermination factor NusG